MKIFNISAYTYNKFANNKSNNKVQDNTPAVTVSNPTSYNVCFDGIRVDKGLTRFYEFNKDRMPQTVKKYIESLDEKTIITPLLAQAAAFVLLKDANDVDDIKATYPEEELFLNLKNPEESNATRGVLSIYRENKELFDAADVSIFNNKENLTVWLVKKVLLEGKTLEEINKDFKNEVNDDFMAFYAEKESSEEPIKHSTLKALGIQMPAFEYLQSLRYTRDGYSDIVGQRISETQRKFWEALPPEERTARARKTVERFENWWNSLSIDQKLEMIANQEDEYQMLTRYNSSNINKRKRQVNLVNPETRHSTGGFKKHTRVNSSLSSDDLFKIWSSNNLKNYLENLTPYEKELLNTKKLQRRAEAWGNMSPEEQTKYLEDLLTGSEYSRYAAIHAWNENPDILTEMSYYLKKRNIERPLDILYGTTGFNDYLSESMSSFWAENSDYSERFGNSLSEAHHLIKQAVSDDKFEILKNDIMLARAARVKKTSVEIKNYKEILSGEEYALYPDYMKRFIDEARHAPEFDYKTLPAQYLKDFFKIAYENLSPEDIDAWTKIWKREPINDEIRSHLKNITTLKTFESEKMNRSLECAIANVLYECTNNPIAYLLSTFEGKYVLKQLSNGEQLLHIPRGNNVFTTLPVIHNNVDVKKIDKLYNEYKQPVTSLDIGTITDRYLYFDKNKDLTLEELHDLYPIFETYASTYGKALEIIFNDENKHPTEVRKALLDRFMSLMPTVLRDKGFDIYLNLDDGFEKDEKITKIDNKLRYELNKIPNNIMNVYIYEVNKRLRKEVSISALNSILNADGLGSEKSIDLDRQNLYYMNQFDILAAEQALADALFDATKDESFYAMPLEALLLCTQQASKEKKFPASLEYKDSQTSQHFNFTVKNKINLYKLEKKYNEYCKELTDYIINTIGSKQQIDTEEILFILNPDETRENVDKYTMERISRVEEYLNK